VGWDRHLESWVVAHRSGALDPVFRWLTYIGTDGAVWLALGLILAARRRRWQLLAWVVVADALAQATTGLIKLAVPRARPHVEALVARPHTHSFPSGHAASSFACAVVLASFAPRLRAPLVLLAALIAWSRAYVGVHYPFDVVAGALWGVAIGLVTLGLARSPRPGRRARGPRQRAAARRR
jgi:undecaprenyl-diphosphatase